MLARFNFSNFASFSYQSTEGSGIQQTEEFSMIPGTAVNHPEHLLNLSSGNLLKLGLIFGDDFSAKSELLKAAAFMKQTVLQGSPVEQNQQYINHNNQENNHPDKAPSYFEMEIDAGKHRYSYGFEIILLQAKFISEWLIELFPDESEQILFQRNFVENSFEIFNDHNSDVKSVLQTTFHNCMKNDQKLLLTEIYLNQENFSQLFTCASACKDVWNWYNDHLVILFTFQNPGFPDLLNIISSNPDTTWFIDDFDQNLPNHLLKHFIPEFLRLTKNTSIQLIACCQNPLLLKNERIRKDEIWFCKKRKDGSSHIYSLDEYKIPENIEIAQAYLDGRFDIS